MSTCAFVSCTDATTCCLAGAMTEHIATLTALADKMRKGLHGNLVDVPVSPKLDAWVEELDRIIADMQAGAR